MKRFDFVVLGGGLSGLAFAKKIAQHGSSVLVLEKEDQVGGLARTLVHNGFHLDFCAHRFHTNNHDLLSEIQSLPELKMDKYIQKSRILMFGKYLKYPFELQNLFRAMHFHKLVISGFSFLINMLFRGFNKKNHDSYKNWFIYYYGEKLYEVMCEPYTSKIWKTDPGSLSADWADQRFQGENMKKLIKRIIKKLLTLDFSDYSLEDESLAPDGGLFYYPKNGIQELSDALVAVANKNGARIYCSAEPTSISRKNKTVEYFYNGKNQKVGYRHLISTIPIHIFNALIHETNRDIENALKGLSYMDIIFVYVYLNKERISHDHWLYFPDKDIVFNRAVEFKNWSPSMCPPNKTSICFDITGFEGKGLFKKTDDWIIKRTIDDAVKVNYIKREDIHDYFIVRVKHAYPFYDLDYKRKLDVVVKALEDESTYLLGRTGLFKYNNADNSIEMAFQLANNFILDSPEKSIYRYSIKKVSY